MHVLKGPSRPSILSAFHRIQFQLGRTPKYWQFRKLSVYSLKDINCRFGKNAWQNLLQSAKIRKETTTWPLTAEHLIQNFLKLQDALGRRPNIGEFLHNCHTPKVLDGVFGKSGWKDLIAAVGAKALPKNIIAASHLVDDYIETLKQLRKKLAFEDFRRVHRHTLKVFDRAFGKTGWSSLKIVA